MSFKIGLSIECIDIEQRNALILALADVLNEHRISERIFTIAYEEKTPRGTKKTVEKIEFSAGETIELSEFDAIVMAERPLETALRTLEGTTISSGGRSVTIPAKRRASQRVWDDDEYKVHAETADESRLTGER